MLFAGLVLATMLVLMVLLARALAANGVDIYATPD
jgi:hypothetical protein